MAEGANGRQVGGNHYSKKGGQIQHWDIVAMFDLDYFPGPDYQVRHEMA